MKFSYNQFVSFLGACVLKSNNIIIGLTGLNPYLLKKPELEQIGLRGLQENDKPREFYNIKVYTSGFRFEYAIKTKVEMLTPIWKLREKDISAIKYYQETLKVENISPDDIYKWIWSYNPYWYKRGYSEFFRPTIAYPLSCK